MTASRTRTTGPQLARLTAVLLTSTMLSGVPQALAQTLPTGGSVAAGSASIGTQSNGALTVTQSSSSAVVNWQSFSVGQGNAVNFVQPSSTSAILNRVTGSATSNIAGQINANGQVYLVNPNGIAITSTGTVNAAGFVASTLGISDSDFMSGKRTFTGNGASASVSNAGSITIGRGGYAALLGGSVDNAGTITVPLGKVGLGSGEQATLDLAGDGFLQVAVPTNAAGTHALVSNSGRISANGGTVQLSAAAARDMARQAINMSGTIEARSVGGRNGAIVLGGSGGAVAVSGKLSVASRRAKGGIIAVTGRDIKLTGATLDASGKTGGGAINIGGGRQGQGPLQRAETTSVDSATKIKADARSAGNGGNVVIWSDLLTTFAGNISARGGALSGNGGEAEVSGKAKLAYAGFTDLSATHGSFGTLLLDPYNVIISNGTDTGGFTATGDDSVINVNTLQTQLGSASVTISTGASGSQAGNITVAAPVTWSAPTTLTLDAAKAIAINSTISLHGAGGVSLTYNTASPTNLTFAQGASIDYGATNQGGTLTINSTSYTLLYSMADVSNVNSLGLGGSYALARSLDASGTTYTDALIGSDNSHGFSGSFEGLGHTIRNLTVDKSGDYAGLFGYSSGTIRDVGLTGESVSGGNYVGGLVGMQDGGAISNAYTTGTVSGSNYIGGLLGVQLNSTISNVYAAGAVRGNNVLGGLVGSQSNSALSNAYATGAVSGNSYIGGLVGLQSDSAISNAYATGAVSGNSYVGGLVGSLITISGTSTVDNSYWDTQTSGKLNGLGSDGNSQSGNVTGLTTAAFQSGGATGLGSAFAGGTNGLYPYLKSFFPNGVQAVSGTAYANLGLAPLASGANGVVTVHVIGGGNAFGTATTGANGYYYVVGAAGSIATNSAVLATITANAATGAKDSATLEILTNTTNQTGVNLYNGALAASTSETTLSAAAATAPVAATSAANGNAAALSAISGATGRYYKATGASFMIDQNVTTSDLFAVSTVAGAPLTVSNAITVNNGGSLGLLSGGALAITAPITVNGAGGVVLAYDASNPTNLSFGLTGTGFSGGLTFANADGSAATTSQGGTLSINGTAHTLLYSMADVVNINTLDLFGKYALANSLDASGTTYTGALIGTGVDGNSIFRGRFDGLGHTISNLTIATSGDYAGLFGFSYGTIQNVGLVGGSVTGVQYVGSLIGSLSYGTITNVYATGSVHGATYVGGLIGLADTINTITNAYATGTVTGTSSYAGGLVGFLYNYSSLTNSFATGAVTGNQYVGGLVGANLNLSPMSDAYAMGAVVGITYVGGLSGWIGDSDTTNTYATGAVIGSNYVGGLAGGNSNGRLISNSYWDIRTTGQVTAFGYDGNGQSGNITGLTTAQFQTAAAAINLGAAFAGGAGLYPYLKSFSPNGVQAISGTAYEDCGATLLASSINGAVTVTAFANGTSFGSATTGANGYYYIFGAAGSIVSGNSLLAYTSGATNSATLGTAISAANQSGLNLFGNALTVSTSATTLSGAPTLGATQTSAIAAAGGDTAATAAINATTGRGIIATGASFTIDQTVNTASTFYVQTTAASAPITVANGITIETGGGLGLNAAGALTINAPITIKGAGSVSLGYDSSSVTNLSFGLTGAGFIGGLTYLDAGGNALTSAPGNQSLVINGQAYALLHSMADVANVTSVGLAGNYALANSLDASGTTYSDALIGPNSSNIFSGVFQGLGHTISNLTISKSGDNVGLIGYSSGLIQNIGLINASVSETNSFGRYVGGLVGYQSGNAIINAYVTGTVSGGSNTGGLVGYLNGGSIVHAYSSAMVSGAATVGGLAGYVGGTVSNAYATGAVTATGNNAGGLIGATDSSTHSANVTDSYATGAVKAGNRAGGLIGFLFGGLNNVYSTGAVSGGTAGGLVGYAYGGSIGNAYWDIDTTGTSIVIGNDPNGLSGNITVQTTAQFQTSATASTLGGAFAGGSGLYPYLASFYPNGVQAISGTAYINGTGTVLASGFSGAGLVNVRVGTGAVQTVTTGTNGYYYAIVPYGTIDTTNGTNVLAYTQANANTGAADGSAFRTAATDTLTSFDISGGWRRDTTALGTLSALDAAYATSVTGTGASGLTLASRSIFAVNDFAFDTALSLPGTLSLSSPSNVTQSAAISANTLILQGFGNTFTLTNTGNRFSQFVAAGGTVNLYDADSLTIAASATDACNCTIAGVSGDQMQIATAGDLTIASGAAVSGISLALSAGGAFINNAGSSAVTATSGRWLVYSADPTGDTFGGLDSGNTAVWNTAAGGTVTATGNRYVFAYQPTLTVTANDATKTYGDVSPLAGYSLGAVNAGITGAFAADTQSDIVSGTASVSSSGSAAGANAGTYTISASQGSLVARGYAISFASGTLTVNTRAITVSADAQSRNYGSANPALTYAVGGLGLVNNDTLSGGLATAANATSNVGSYAITQGTLAASSNYAMTYSGANLAVTQRAITVMADAQSRIYGNANPALTYTVSGLDFVNGDLLSGALATDADSSSAAGRYAITRGSLSASTNYAMTFVPGTLTVDAVINPPATEIASTLANNPPVGAAITPAMLPMIVSPPSARSSADGSGPTVLSVDPRFDGVVICSGLNCVVAR